MKVNENIFFDLSDLAALGEHSIIGITVRVRKPHRVRIGHHSIIDDFAYISSGLTVGNYTHIAANAVIIGGNANVAIGDFVNIASSCRLVAASHDFAEGGLSGPTIPEEFAAPTIQEDIIIADHVLLGTGTIVLPGTHIPEGLSTGAMTLLSSKMQLEPWTLYVGNPARRLKKRNSRKILDAAAHLLSNKKTETS